ncbi:hypothetical protein [endosymbiont GvMRE of Glomus versiforme]|uniref:hypothetical protein n=1 Tax=endosymbiont GvMRE of Glomus versiforme TaxID=2039283 RepID=UPI00155978FD|nr:hypothetical protein [endosymbiont GvMRE of Glomus versiforme]
MDNVDMSDEHKGQINIFLFDKLLISVISNAKGCDDNTHIRKKDINHVFLNN